MKRFQLATFVAVFLLVVPSLAHAQRRPISPTADTLAAWRAIGGSCLARRDLRPHFKSCTTYFIRAIASPPDSSPSGDVFELYGRTITDGVERDQQGRLKITFFAADSPTELPAAAEAIPYRTEVSEAFSIFNDAPPRSLEYVGSVGVVVVQAEPLDIVCDQLERRQAVLFGTK